MERIPLAIWSFLVTRLVTVILGGLLSVSVTGTALAQWYPPPPNYYGPPHRGGYGGPTPAQYGACGPYVRPYYAPPYYGAQWVCGERSGRWHWR
jgi:hypothetical protein